MYTKCNKHQVTTINKPLHYQRAKGNSATRQSMISLGGVQVSGTPNNNSKYPTNYSYKQPTNAERGIASNIKKEGGVKL